MFINNIQLKNNLQKKLDKTKSVHLTAFFGIISNKGLRTFFVYPDYTSNGSDFLSRIPVNIPNILTMIRFLLVPVVTIFIYFRMLIPAFITYGIACLTDLLDGYIARKKHLVTDEGMLLDPLADKLMANFAIIAFTVIGVLPPFILIILLTKDVIMISGGIFMYFKNIITSANTFGKIAAFLFNIAIALTFFHQHIGPWHIYIICFALLFMVATLIQYTVINLNKLAQTKKRVQI